jgi:hypothetical protein
MPISGSHGMDKFEEHDAGARLWASIELAHKNFAVNQRELGKLFVDLKNLYSERGTSQPGGRLTSGHGTFQAEIIKRGYKPNRVREWVVDYEVAIGLRLPAESTAAKRKARRPPSRAEFNRGYQAAMNDFPTAAAGESDPVSHFAALLPFGALRSAYRAALHEVHPDHGGSEERTKELIEAWEEVERLHRSVESEEIGGCVRGQ